MFGCDRGRWTCIIFRNKHSPIFGFSNFILIKHFKKIIEISVDLSNIGSAAIASYFPGAWGMGALLNRICRRRARTGALGMVRQCFANGSFRGWSISLASFKILDLTSKLQAILFTESPCCMAYKPFASRTYVLRWHVLHPWTRVPSAYRHSPADMYE
jgi:hypothetical protein